MARSRSSFEGRAAPRGFELSGAIATATSLSGEVEERPRLFQGVALVSFEREAQPPPPSARPSPSPPRARIPTPDHVLAVDPSGRHAPASPASDPPESVDARRPPKLPDLSGVVSPIVRCEKIVEWIEEATGASDVFLADQSGLPIAGAVAEAEARLAGAGLVAASIAQLAASLPGASAPLFELHVGDGPFFQLVGFAASGAMYLVGFWRPTPLTPRQAHAVRLACRHALGDTLGTAP